MEFNLDDLLKDHRLYHSEFQQDYFITTRSGGTVYGQYKQALREVYKRFRGLKGLYHERDMAKVDLEELIFKAKNEADIFEAKRNKLNITKSELDLIEMEKNIEDTEREFKRFYEQCVSLKQKLPELTDEVRRKLDKEMWLHKLKEICAVDFLSSGRLKNTTIELIGSIPIEDRKVLIDETIRNQAKLIEWYETKNEEFEIKKIDVDLQKLLD
jgi:hypothetical protein